jgi:cell division protein FtsZ
MGILTVGVVTKPFHFESGRRMRVAEAGIAEMQKSVDTLIIIPNQNLFRVASERTTFADAFVMADQVLCSGVACITDLMVKEGLVNLDFADVCAVMSEMGTAMIGTGEATGDRHALRAAEAAIANPLFDDSSVKGARGLLISITGGHELTLYDVDEAAGRIRQEVDDETNIIVGATFDPSLGEAVRVSVVATGIDRAANSMAPPTSGQLRRDLTLSSSMAAAEAVEGASTPHEELETDTPFLTNSDYPTVPAAVIRFPGPIERARGADVEAQPIPSDTRRRSLLERLGVTVSGTLQMRRAAGWR